jgi:hypothetical protein
VDGLENGTVVLVLVLVLVLLVGSMKEAMLRTVPSK